MRCKKKAYDAAVLFINLVTYMHYAHYEKKKVPSSRIIADTNKELMSFVNVRWYFLYVNKGLCAMHFFLFETVGNFCAGQFIFICFFKRKIPAFTVW